MLKGFHRRTLQERQEIDPADDDVHPGYLLMLVFLHGLLACKTMLILPHLS